MVNERNETRIYIEKQKPSTFWKIEIVAGALVGMKENGEPINPASIVNNHPRIASAIYNYPGGYNKVARIAGYNPEEERVFRKTKQGGGDNK